VSTADRRWDGSAAEDLLVDESGVQKNVLHAPLGHDDRDDLLVDESGVGDFCADECGAGRLRADAAGVAS